MERLGSERLRSGEEPEIRFLAVAARFGAESASSRSRLGLEPSFVTGFSLSRVGRRPMGTPSRPRPVCARRSSIALRRRTGIGPGFAWLFCPAVSPMPLSRRLLADFIVYFHSTAPQRSGTARPDARAWKLNFAVGPRMGILSRFRGVAIESRGCKGDEGDGENVGMPGQRLDDAVFHPSSRRGRRMMAGIITRGRTGVRGRSAASRRRRR